MTSIPTRGVKFYSGARSVVLRGPSGKTYQFFREQDSAAVVDPRDIQYFRTRDDVFEEGTPPDLIHGARNRHAKHRPKSYRMAGRRNIDPALLQPPSEEKLRAAEERRRLYERRTKEEQEAVAAKATAEVGVGTEEAQLRREANARAAAGKEEKVPKPQAPPKSSMTPENETKSLEPEVEAPAEDVQGTAEVTEEESKLKYACPYCGRPFKSEAGMKTHANKWCKKNPALKK